MLFVTLSNWYHALSVSAYSCGIACLCYNIPSSLYSINIQYGKKGVYSTHFLGVEVFWLGDLIPWRDKADPPLECPYQWANWVD